MKHKISIIYSWFVRTITFFLPNIPILMRFRGSLYSLLIPNCGKNFQITSSAYINSLSGLNIGNNVYIAHNTVLIGTNISIGDNVLIGPNSVISSGNHVFSNDSFYNKKSNKGTVIIGKGSWIGANCSILANSTLPEKSILAAGSVLTKKFTDEYSIYAGTPAKYIKKHTTKYN